MTDDRAPYTKSSCPYHGGSIGSNGRRCRQARKAERVEEGVGQRCCTATWRAMRQYAGPAPAATAAWKGDTPRRRRWPYPGRPVLPLSPDVHAQSATNPGVQVPQHDRRLSETEVGSPADWVPRQRRDQLREADAERPTRQFSILPSEFLPAPPLERPWPELAPERRGRSRSPAEGISTA